VTIGGESQQDRLRQVGRRQASMSADTGLLLGAFALHFVELALRDSSVERPRALNFPPALHISVPLTTLRMRLFVPATVCQRRCHTPTVVRRHLFTPGPIGT